jgi:ketosteroid isomerase-like protein
MKRSVFFPAIAACCLLLASCSDTKEKTSEPAMVAEAATADLVQIRKDIQGVENSWAEAINTKNLDALMALYGEGAVSMPPGAPSLSGKEAIRKHQEMELAGKRPFASIVFETQDVYAQGNVVTEVGKTMFKDSTGAVTTAGKYVSVYEKQNGKYVCIREIYNDDK